jgi:hypothetical protein
MKRNLKPVTERDYAVLKFLWFWKVSTTAALKLKFFPECAPQTAYNRLRELEKRGMILGRADVTGRYFVWTLTANGNARVKWALPELKHDGYRSEYPAHDLLVAAIHNGDWLLSRPKSVEVFTEQQMRRYAEHSCPEWVPTDESHRPDGYWRFTNGVMADRTIALEVELHQKSKTDYRSVARFYDDHRFIERVLWVVPRASTARRLAELLLEWDDREWNPHVFAAVPEVLKLGWAAPILIGKDQGRTIADVLSPESMQRAEKIHERPMHSPEPNLISSLLNVAKTPHKSKAPKCFSFV